MVAASIALFTGGLRTYPLSRRRLCLYVCRAQEKTALAAERAWLLEELQRAKEVRGRTVLYYKKSRAEKYGGIACSIATWSTLGLLCSSSIG